MEISFWLTRWWMGLSSKPRMWWIQTGSASNCAEWTPSLVSERPWCISHKNVSGKPPVWCSHGLGCHQWNVVGARNLHMSCEKVCGCEAAHPGEHQWVQSGSKACTAATSHLLWFGNFVLWTWVWKLSSDKLNFKEKLMKWLWRQPGAVSYVPVTLIQCPLDI